MEQWNRYVLTNAEYVKARRDSLAVAEHDINVLILGETGSGKEFMADLIQSHSKRESKPYVKVNCSSIPEQLIESELFGHEKGAFTGAIDRRKGKIEAANGGTLLLDEIGDMPLILQSRLLRVADKQPFNRVGGNEDVIVDVRFISATNMDLESAIETGKFRSDLYYRLSGMIIHVPPLHVMKEDIIGLAREMLQDMRANKEITTNAIDFAQDAIDTIIIHKWPGNFRELRNRISVGALSASGEKITTGDMFGEKQIVKKTTMSMGEYFSLIENLNLVDLEKTAIEVALKRKNWVQKDAAVVLGISPRALNYKIHFHRITHESWKVNV